MTEIRKYKVSAEEWQKALAQLAIKECEYQIENSTKWYQWDNDDSDNKSLMRNEIIAIRKGTLQSEKQPDNINSPEHYTAGGIETIDFIKAKLTKEEFIGYCMGNCLKYMSRCKHKGNQVEDLKKAQWYLNKAIGEIENV